MYKQRDDSLNYQSPKTVSEAVASLANDKWTVLSGGTDFYPGLADQQPVGNILDVSQLQGLRDINKREDGSWSIGARVTWTDIIQANLPNAFDGLKAAAREVGSIQIQNRATVVGNICNASPAADGVPPLLTLDVVVEISSNAGQRSVPLQDFLLGNRETTLQSQELVTAITIPKSAAAGVSSFIKLGTRKYLVISISMVAARLVLDAQNTILDAAICVGSCSAVAMRLPTLEQNLIGQPLCQKTCDAIASTHLQGLSPIDDVRATRTYRQAASLELVKRSVASISQREKA